jgi:DNA polymerase-3 subunit alpha
LELAAFATVNSEVIADRIDGSDVSLGGIVQSLKVSYDKHSKQMAFVTVEDFYGVVEVVVFADLFERSRQLIRTDAVLLARGRVSTRENEKPKLIASEIAQLEGLFDQKTAVMEIFINGGASAKLFEDIELLLRRYPGPVGVQLAIVSSSQLFHLIPKNLRVRPEGKLYEQLSHLVGKENINFKPVT